MSKALYIIRHAKSDWGFELKDFDRPLSARGFKDAPAMANRLHALTPEIDCLISSPAKRAITTAQIFADVLHIPIKDIQTRESIYEAGVESLLGVVNAIDDAYATVALFGHNPGFTMLTNYLGNANIFNIPTCGIVRLQFPHADSWAEVSGGTGETLNFMYPKDAQ